MKQHARLEWSMAGFFKGHWIIEVIDLGHKVDISKKFGGPWKDNLEAFDALSKHGWELAAAYDGDGGDMKFILRRDC
jgi:hypothetical protein